MAGKHVEAYEALLTEVKRQTAALKDSGMSPMMQARTLSEIALAFRYTSGGPQPGNTVVEK